MKKETLFLLIGIVLLIVVLLTSLIFSGKTTVQPSPLPSSIQAQPSRYPIVSIQPTYFPPKMNDLSYLPENKGGGIDVKSDAVRQSSNEINKLNDSLPYTNNLTLKNGTKVSISIPPKNLQLNAWTLTVQIFGIDYQVGKDSTEYQQMKQEFIEASNTVFAWMSSKGANPEKIIISWGDRAIIQQRAEEWLSK